MRLRFISLCCDSIPNLCTMKILNRCGFFLTASAVVTASAGSSPAQASITGFNNFTGWTVNQTDADSFPSLTADKLHLTNSDAAESRSIFYNTPQSVSTFKVSFTYQEATPGVNGAASGVCFVLENSPAGVNAIGNADHFGYGNGNPAVSPSAAILLEGNPSTTGLFVNGNLGGEGSGTTTGSVNIFSGDPINVTLTYSPATLVETLVDNSASYTATYPINLASVLNGSTAYVGFTGGTSSFGGQYNPSDQYISNFQYTTAVPEPINLSVVAMGGVLALRRKRLFPR